METEGETKKVCICMEGTRGDCTRGREGNDGMLFVGETNLEMKKSAMTDGSLTAMLH
jgi:hypothetical protein